MQSIPTDMLQSDDGAKHIANSIYKRDSLTGLSTLYTDFNNLVSYVHGSNVSFKNYETRFAALISKFNGHGASLNLPESITAFMIMSSADINDSHCVSILAAAAKDVMVAKREDSQNAKNVSQMTTLFKLWPMKQWHLFCGNVSVEIMLSRHPDDP